MYQNQNKTPTKHLYHIHIPTAYQNQNSIKKKAHKILQFCEEFCD